MNGKNTKNSRLEMLYLISCLIRLANSPQYDRADLLAAVEAAITLLEAGNSDTCGHSSGVAFIAFFIADRLGLSAREQDKIKLAALVHDIGKVKCEEYPGQHALLGSQIIRCIPHMGEIADMVLFHHICLHGATGSVPQIWASIPLGARVIAVADAFQKCLVHCHGKKISGKDGILRELRSQAISDLDPRIVDIAAENYELLAGFVG
jgi:putative nucleotidyltransferase with HDIG domain